MTERDAKIERAKIDVRQAEIKLQLAKEKMDAGCAEAKAIHDAKVAALKADWLLCAQELEREKVYVTEFEEVVGGSQ